jgi:hypothetical protein
MKKSKIYKEAMEKAEKLQILADVLHSVKCDPGITPFEFTLIINNEFNRQERMSIKRYLSYGKTK